MELSHYCTDGSLNGGLLEIHFYNFRRAYLARREKLIADLRLNSKDNTLLITVPNFLFCCRTNWFSSDSG